MKPGHFTDLLHGKRHVGAAIALKLQKLLDIPAEYSMRVQVYHDLFIERNKEMEGSLKFKVSPTRYLQLRPMHAVYYTHTGGEQRLYDYKGSDYLCMWVGVGTYL